MPISSLISTPEIGKPDPIPLPTVTISGVTPLCSTPHHLPVRPKPVIISSAISSAPLSFATDLIAGSQSSGGITLPAVPCIGSTITAATAPADEFLICWRANSTQYSPQSG